MNSNRSDQKKNPLESRIGALETKMGSLEQALGNNTKTLGNLENALNQPNQALLDSIQSMLGKSVEGAIKEAVEKVDEGYQQKIAEKDRQNKALMDQIQEEKNARIELEGKLSKMLTADDIAHLASVDQVASIVDEKTSALTTKDDLERVEKGFLKAHKNLYKRLAKKSDEVFNGLSNLASAVSAGHKELMNQTIAILTRLETLDEFIESAKALGERFGNMLTSVYRKEAKRDVKIAEQIDQAGVYADEMRDSADMMASAAETSAGVKENLHVLNNEFKSIGKTVSKAPEDIAALIRDAQSDLTNLWNVYNRGFDNTLKESVQTIRNMESEHESRISAQVAKLNERISQTKSILTGMQEHASNQDDNSTKLTTAIAGLRRDITELGHMKTVSPKMDAMISSLELISDTLGMAFSMDDVEDDNNEDNA